MALLSWFFASGDSQASFISNMINRVALGVAHLINYLLTPIRRCSQYQTFARSIRQAEISRSSFEESGTHEDLDSAISFRQAAVDCCPRDHPNLSAVLHSLAFLVHTRFEKRGEGDDLERAVLLNRTALELRPDGHPSRSFSLASLASCLEMRFNCHGKREDLDEAILLDRAALALRPDGHSHRSLSLGNLAASLRTRFNHFGVLEDLEEAIMLNRAALKLRPEGHPGRSVPLGNLASNLWMRFKHGGRMEDLEEAISQERAALALRPEGHPNRSSSLANLAASLRTRFSHGGAVEDLEESISLERAALDLRPEGRRDHSASLGNLSNSLWMRFTRGGQMKDLEEAISLNRVALELRPEGHPSRSLTMSNLANNLYTRFQHEGRIKDLEEAISLERNALQLRADGHPDRSSSFANLSGCLLTRFQHSGRMVDLEESISLGRAALELRSECHPNRSSSLANLATSLWMRFQHGRRIEDLEESIAVERATLELLSESHPHHTSALGNLASSLWTRFQHVGTIEDLEEAISLDRTALALRPEGHPDRPLSLTNLANCLRTRFTRGGDIDDIEETILLERTALDHRPGAHPDRPSSLGNLARSIWMRFQHVGKMEDLEEAISLSRAALGLLPVDHPDCSSLLRNLGDFLHVRFHSEGRMDDFEDSIQSWRRAASCALSSFATRLDAAHRWTTIARTHDHDSLIDADRMAMSLLQRALAIRPTLSEQHMLLCSDNRYQSIALDAAADAISKGELFQAIEFLEQGRALLWSQMRRYRTPLEQLSEVDETLADRFQDCTYRLEALVTQPKPRTIELGSGALGVPGCSAVREQHSIDEMLAQMRQLSEEQEAVISDIQRKPGFENFLEASPFSVLQQAASEGPVIVLNHSEYRCDALIILANGSPPCVCVPVDKDFYAAANSLHAELAQIRGTSGVDSEEYDEVLRRVMKALWDGVIFKVVQQLKELGVGEGSRIWWCPTSVLSAFPFHAAGPYEGVDGGMKYLLDDYISSYTPTLTSLINARTGAENGGERMLFVGDTSLPSAKKERDAIVRIRRFKELLGRRATPKAVLKLLQGAHWVHFTCHGTLGKEPFNSSLKLSSGGLTLLDIARSHLPNAEFAFLSACHTAEQRPDSALDEALHLAAGIQFCGFRSVVGTMWQLLDHDGPLLASAVYRYLMCDLEKGEIRFKRAAAAVRLAALNLREHGDVDPRTGKLMTERWVNLVHMGA